MRWSARRGEVTLVIPETFLTRWELEASAAEVSALLADATGLPGWWPAVFLDAREIEPGDASGVGQLVEVVTAGFLPWTLRWTIRTTIAEPGARLGVEAAGDVEGIGLWALEPFGNRVVVRFRFLGGISGRLWRNLPTIARPLFRRSYVWAMERGFTSLMLEVWRRRTNDVVARSWLPRPPRPAFPHGLRRWFLARRRQGAEGPNGKGSSTSEVSR